MGKKGKTKRVDEKRRMLHFTLKPWQTSILFCLAAFYLHGRLRGELAAARAPRAAPVLMARPRLPSSTYPELCPAKLLLQLST